MWRDPDDVLTVLAGLFRVLYDALEAATQTAKAHIEEYGLPHDPHAFATLVRIHAMKRLDAGGHDVEIEREELQNCGLLLRHGPYVIRILRPDEGRLPAPGPSKRKRAFYKQPLLPYFQIEAAESTSAAVNLIVLWHTNGLHNLDSLSVALPTGGGIGRGSATALWHVPVPHPAPTIIQATETTLAIDAEVGDLDLALADQTGLSPVMDDAAGDLDLMLADDVVSESDDASLNAKEATDDPRSAGQTGA